MSVAAKNKPASSLRLAATAGDIEQPYVDLFNRFIASDRAEFGGDWVRDLRRGAMNAFKRAGFPHKRVEAWKYTDFRPHMRETFDLPQAAGEPLTSHEWLSSLPNDICNIVFVDGHLSPALSDLDALPSGVEVVPLTQLTSDSPAWIQDNLARVESDDARPLIDLNTALMHDGVLIRVSQGTHVSRPIQLIFENVTGGYQSHIRNLLIAESDTQLSLIEVYLGTADQPYWMNSVLQIIGNEGADIRHYKIQSEAKNALHVANVLVRLEKNAAYDGFHLTEGAALSRHDGHYTLAGEGANLTVNGVYMLTGRQHCDNTTIIDHTAPQCTSREIFHGVLTDRSRGVFQGKIHVHPHAQKTDGYQLSKAILLSDKAEIDAKPELEIYADDVKCSHGATAGQLDEQAIFYLRSRGLSVAQAKGVLIEAFLDDVIDTIKDAAFREPFKQTVSRWLDRHA